jgi:ceramide glucosyltransferase
VTVAIACLLLLALSVAIYSAGAASLAALRRERRGSPLPGFFPPVSIVKPLSGLDDELERNLESFYRIDYPAYEILYSFAHRSDAAFSVARRVADRHPGVPSVFVVDAREPGGNSKVSRLAAALRHARFRYVLMADGNVRVHPEFLRRAISFFANPSVGLVSHLFRARGARTLGSRLESLYLNDALRAGTAAIARILGVPCVVGKSILVSRESLNAIGGIEAVRDHLAEDYLLGRMIARAGYRTVLSGDEIETAEVSRSLAAAWSRQRRWAILRKRLGGFSYVAEVLANPLPWFAGTLLAARGEPGLVACAAALYLLRACLEAFTVARPETLSATDWLLIPLRDAAVAGLFFTGLIGVRTCWRGRTFRVGRDTLIEPLPAGAGRFAGPAHQAAERG